MTASKGQLGLVEAFDRFRALFAGPSRLVLVGRQDDTPYVSALLHQVRRRGLDTGAVELAGLVPDAELRRRYAEADLYVSLSAHEGFGVPLVEAVAHGVPVLAVGAGAVPFTLGAAGGMQAAGLLADASPAGAAAQMLALAQDGAARAALAQAQRAAVGRFALPAQTPALVDALVRAGAARPRDPAMAQALAAHARFTLAGHVNGSYSLAAINRSLALALEAERPGCVRLVAVEGDVTTEVGGGGDCTRSRLGALLARPAPTTGPHVVISQHYPVWVPPEPGDVPLAQFFWEESLVPEATVAVLNQGFRGVVAPSHTVAKALVDSGLQVPVRVIPHRPGLDAFRALREDRTRPERAGPFTFLHVSSCFPRKGVDVLLAAWARAFGPGDGVRLVIKGFPNPHNTVAADLARLRAAGPPLAEVVLIDEDLAAADVLDLYRQADAVVLPTRGEGFNLPAAEALAAGIPLIVTGWGGHMDFVVPSADVRLLRYRFAPSGTHLATPFSLWAEPDEDDLVAALREMAAGGRRVAAATGPEAPEVAGPLARFAADLLTAPQMGPQTVSVGWVTTWDVRCGIAEYSRHLVGAVPLPGAVFADMRTPAGQFGGVPVLPGWRLADPASMATLMGALVRQDPAVVVIQHQPGLVPWAQLPAMLSHPALQGRAVAIVLHNTQDLADTPDPVRADAVAALGQVSRVVVHSVRDLNTLAALGLGPRATLIPQGVEAGLAAAPVAGLSPSDPVLIGCYGFFLPDKGIPQLIEALGLLRQTWPEARLRLVNAEYPLPQSAAEIATCRALADRLGLARAVAFETAFLDHAASRAMLRDCAVVALPYQQSKEGSSAALRSALSAGVPVAVTPLPLFEEAAPAVLTLHGTTPQAIAAGLDALLRNPATRKAVAAGSETWRAERNWSHIGRRWQGMLTGLAVSRLSDADD